MKSPFALSALLMLMLLALLPFGAQAHGDGMPGHGHAVSAAAEHSAHTAHHAPAASAAATTIPAAAHHNCHHGGTHDCRCTQACGAASALPLARHAPLVTYFARNEMPRHGRTVATRAPPPIDLLRPPTSPL